MLQTRQGSCGEVKTLLSHTLVSTQSLPHFRETSVWNLVHYNWAGSLWNRRILEQRAGSFFTSFVLVRHR